MLKNTVKPFNDLDDLVGHNWDWLEKDCEVSDWIDENTCVVNYPEEYYLNYSGGRDNVTTWGVHLFNKQTKESTPLVLSSTRINWSGIVDPSGKEIAFLSALKSGGNAAIYRVSTNGGEPVKICEGISVGRTLHSNVASRIHAGEVIYGRTKNISFLLDWK